MPHCDCAKGSSKVTESLGPCGTSGLLSGVAGVEKVEPIMTRRLPPPRELRTVRLRGSGSFVEAELGRSWYSSSKPGTGDSGQTSLWRCMNLGGVEVGKV